MKTLFRPTTRQRIKKGARRNPLRGGYSRDTVTANIVELIRAGHPPKQAEAIAFKEARAAYRKEHPRATFPRHLLARNPSFKTGPNTGTGKGSLPPGVVRQNERPAYVIEQKRLRPGVVSNPISDAEGFSKAVKLYDDFHGEPPRFVDEFDVRVPAVALMVGKCTGIAYLAKRDGKTVEYFHEFTGKARPILAASSDGRQLIFLEGDYKFTDRGIVDGTISIR